MKKKTKNMKHIRRTVQDTIPYIEGYKNGVFQVETGRFSKTLELKDISFKTQSEEDQEMTFSRYLKLLNAINEGEDIFFSFVNYKEKTANTLNSVLPQIKGDEFDHFRNELSKMIKDKATDNNNIKTRKFATLRADAPTVDEGIKKIDTIESEFISSYRKITKIAPKPLNLANRLDLLSSILNGMEPNYYIKHDSVGNAIIDFDELKKKKLSTKDIIAPEAMKFNGSNFMIGDRYGQTFYLDNIANWMNTNFLADLTEINFESCITLHIEAIPQTDAMKLINDRSVNINAEINEKIKKSPTGYLPKALKNIAEQVDDLQEDLSNRDQKLFYMSLVIMIFADSESELKDNAKIIKGISNKYMSKIQPLIMQQEAGFTSALPLGLDRTFTKRLLTTESLGVFLPFDEVHTFDEGGFYYGTNSINKSLIIHNRLKGQNYNGLIFGSSGSGKSLAAKRELSNVFLNTDASIYVIDPDAEYSPLAEAYHGSVIRIAPGNGVYINPFDLDIDISHDNDGNPLTIKTDFICGMLETMIGENSKLSPSQKSIVDRCIRQIYTPYLQHLAELPVGPDGKRKTIDREYCPTMQNLFDSLLSQAQPEAQNLALIMETYTTGNFDTFAHRTNVDLSNRFIVYDITNIGANLRELALKVCTNDIWNKLMENRRKNKWTWFYIDEFHLLMRNDSTSEFLKSIWKRARKWWGVPCGITQNVEDLLESSYARAIINNSNFVYMMNQSKMDRDMLSQILGLSENDIEYITNADEGCGLLYTGQQTIPFDGTFPKDTELFKLIDTKGEK